MPTFRNHQGKLILICSILLTYPMFMKLSNISFPNIYATIFASFGASFIIVDVIIRTIVDLIGSETILYSGNSLRDLDITLLWNQVIHKKYIRIDFKEDNFIISIRTQESNHNGCGVYFYLLDSDGVFHKDNTSETLDFIQCSEFMDYNSFGTLMYRKYNKLLSKGKEIYGDIN